MNAMRLGVLTAGVVLASLAWTQTTKNTTSSQRSARDKLIGAWRLVRIDSPGSDGHSIAAQPKGMLIYSQDGHVSVQLMYPKGANVPSNEYVHDGYEASFGSYDVDEATHTVTHHVQGSITRDLLVGKDLPRAYRFTRDGHLIIRSLRPDEHWSVTWEHY
ncbi:MAG TPA: lipocalin-like domain-containing protein [Acidobacteriaceae bacterium]|nr:lipocalin-like domain-containing protein [Acidobacteriaceae bacterium]